MTRQSARLTAWALSLPLALAAALPAVWWTPLHVDEKVTLWFAPRSFSGIVHDIFVDRGGGPVFFLVEHVTLAWPGGLEGLRLPPVVFFLLALPAAGLLARELRDELEAAFVPVTLALAPLAVSLATFARMYSLLLLVVLVAMWLSLRAASTGGTGRWAAAGALCGALAYVHPIGPLYGVLAFAGGLVRSRASPRALIAEAWPGAAAFIAVALPYGYALAVVGARYDVASGGSLLRTASGRSVPEESLHALTASATAGLIALPLLALVGLASLVLAERRTAVILAMWVAVPIAFFSLVPVGGTRFYDRYLIGALAPFLILVVTGAVAIGRIAGRRALVAAAVLGGVLALQALSDFNRLADLRGARLHRLVDAAAPYRTRGALFSSTGMRTARPPELLDDYVALELPGIQRVEELPSIDPWYEPGLRPRGVAELTRFVKSNRRSLIGLWLFSGRPRDVQSAFARLAAVEAVVAVRVTPRLLLVRSRVPEPGSKLVEQAADVRAAWLGTGRLQRMAVLILRIDREALASLRAPG
jgi:hypothetical protein